MLMWASSKHNREEDKQLISLIAIKGQKVQARCLEESTLPDFLTKDTVLMKWQCGRREPLRNWKAPVRMSGKDIRAGENQGLLLRTSVLARLLFNPAIHLFAEGTDTWSSGEPFAIISVSNCHTVHLKLICRTSIISQQSWGKIS